MPDETTVVDGETTDDTTLVTGNDEENVSGNEEEGEKKDDAEKLFDKPKEGDDDENSEDGKDDADKDDKGAPEKYEDFKLPEGMEKDAALLEQALPVFTELNLTQDQAQKLIDLQTKHITEAAAAQQRAWDKTFEGWEASTKADAEIGGKDFDANVGVAKTAVKTFANEEFKEMLNSTGIGSHPEMVRFLFKVGKAISNDQVLQGEATGGPRDPAKTLFPDMK